MPTNHRTQRHLTLVPDPEPASLGAALEALHNSGFDAFDRVIRAHTRPDLNSSVERDLAAARDLLGGDAA